MSDPKVIEIVAAGGYLWCPHDRAIGFADDDRATTFGCDDCADAWDRGAAATVVTA